MSGILKDVDTTLDIGALNLPEQEKEKVNRLSGLNPGLTSLTGGGNTNKEDKTQTANGISAVREKVKQEIAGYIKSKIPSDLLKNMPSGLKDVFGTFGLKVDYDIKTGDYGFGFEGDPHEIFEKLTGYFGEPSNVKKPPRSFGR